MRTERGFLTKPAVKRELATWLPNGPHRCCADWAIVTDCDRETDHLHCGICGFKWTRPCSESDLVANA